MNAERRGPAIEPREIDRESERALRITWGDGSVSRYGSSELRRACPCAACVDEWTGRRTLDPAAIPEETVMVDLELVGRYALNFKWSDGHDTGIYSFRYLRELSEGGPEK